MLLVHSGNRIDLGNRVVARFPSTQVPTVRARVARLLESLQPCAVVSAPAAGADLVVIGEAIRLGVRIHLVLPIGRDDFLERSVIDGGPEWIDEFEAALHHASTTPGCSLEEAGESPAPDWYLTAQDQLLRRAEAVADGQTIVALTVRPPEGESPPSATDHFASRAERLGMLVLTIDPRPASPSTTTVG